MEKQGHMRSSSSSSSSSFDSCSDLLGCLELPEKNPADYVTLSEVQQSEIVSCSKENSGAKDSCSDVLCHQVLQELEDERLLTGQVLDLCEQSMEGSKEEVPQVKDDHVTMEAPTLKDHVYGLSSSITFSKVRSLAENTVEKISQLHSSFRLPTGYLFPSKSVESVDNKPCASEVDSKMSVPTEPSHSYEEHSIEGTKFSQDFSGSKPDNRRPGWGDIKPLQPKELVNMEYMPCGGLCEKSACVKALDNVHIQGSSSVERIGLKTEQMSKMEDTTNPCLENVHIQGSSSVERIGLKTEQMSKMEDTTNPCLENVCGVDFKLATDTNDVTRNDALGSDSMLQVSINENKGGRPADLGKEASSDIDLKGLGFQKLQNLQQLMPFWQTSQPSDFTTMVEEVQDGIGLDCSFQDHACIPKSGLQVSVALEAGHDLQRLEESIKVFDLHKKNSVPPPPLQTLSSGSGRPDLEEVDDDQFSLISSLPGGAIQKNRMLANRPLSGKEPYFATTALGLESQARIDHQGYMLKGNESPSSICGQRVQVVGSPLLNCVDEGRDFLRNDRLIVTEALETLDLQCRQQRLLEEESYGERSNQEGWKGLCIRLKSQKPFNWEEEEEENLGPDELFRYVENLDLNETYVDTVLDMEDVLLDCDESGSRGRFFLAANNSVIGTPRSSRDGSLSSSTSGLQLFISNTTGSGECTPFTVDWVEVVGAKQRKGGSSFGERIVGVKDHTVYCIKVSSGSQEWEVLRRYRDFVELYHQLRRKFNARTERPLPSPWKEVESESRKVFGSTTPNVIEVRSGRMEKCLQSLLQAGPPFSISPPLHWFLRLQGTAGGLSGFEDHQSIASLVSHKGSDVQLGALNSPHLQSPRSEIGSSKGELDHDKSPFSLGKTIKLVLEIHPNKNLKQLLSAQHHSCAGCYKHLDVEKGLVQGFVQSLGWGKPRLCEYSGQLFCASCHLNETAVLPAQVLRHWDFTPRRVSQLAKAYLDSIYDQPMLCVSAVNPYLYSRVPILSHVKETRRKLSKMLSCMHCPSHARIQQTMVSRRYLLENNDFFALRDLEDLSKGAFAVLPGLLTAVLESLRVHITKQCSVCQDTGEWCGAGILCDDPFSPIFPFQEENITSCKLCHAPFHETCFSKCSSCPSCPKDWSKKPVLAAGCSHFKMEELGDDHTDVLPFPNGQVGDKAVDCSASSSSSGPELQGPTEEKQSQNQRNWPSFYNLLPKRRLW